MKNKSVKSIVKKVFGILLNVLVYLFFAFCVFLLIVSVTAKKDSDGSAIIFGHEMRIVVSPSMEKCDETPVNDFEIKDIPVRSMVFIELVPDDKDKAAEWYSALKVGDVLTFRYEYLNQQLTITHRIQSIVENESGGYTIKLAGDNKNDADGVLEQEIDTSKADTGKNYIIGKVTYVSAFIGYFVYSISQPVGLIFIIIIPCAVIIMLMIVRIFAAVSGDRRKKDEEDKARKDDEIEELKRKLAELESDASREGRENDKKS